MAPQIQQLEKIAEAYHQHAASNGKKVPDELGAGPKFKYTIALAAWHIKDLRKGSMAALEDAFSVAEAMLAGTTISAADLDKSSNKSLVFKLATSLISNDNIYGISDFANSDKMPPLRTASPLDPIMPRSSGNRMQMHGAETFHSSGGLMGTEVAGRTLCGEKENAGEGSQHGCMGRGESAVGLEVARLQGAKGAISISAVPLLDVQMADGVTEQQRRRGQEIQIAQEEGLIPHTEHGYDPQQQVELGESHGEDEQQQQGGQEGQAGEEVEHEEDDIHGQAGDAKKGASVPTKIPLLLISLEEVSFDQLNQALQWNTKTAEVDFEYGALKFEPVMSFEFRGKSIEVEMVKLYKEGLKIPSFSKVKMVQKELCEAMGFDSSSTTVKQQVFTLWSDYLDPLSARRPYGLGHLSMGEAIIWDGDRLPSPQEAIERAVAEFEARRTSAAAAAGVQGARKKALRNLEHNKTCEVCGTDGQGNNKLACRSCGEPFPKKVKLMDVPPASLPTDVITSTNRLRTGLRKVINAADAVTRDYGGSIAILHIIPVRYPAAAATSAIPDRKEVVNLVYAPGDLPEAEKELVEKEYQGLKLLIMRHATGGEDSPAFKVVNSAACMAAAVGEGRKYLKERLKEDVRAMALQKAQQQQVQGDTSQKVFDAVDADKGVAIAALLEKALVTHLGPTLEQERVDLWALKKLVCDEQAWRDMGLKWADVAKLKDVL